MPKLLGDVVGGTKFALFYTPHGCFDPQLSAPLEIARALDLEMLFVPRALRAELAAFVASAGELLLSHQVSMRPVSR